MKLGTLARYMVRADHDGMELQLPLLVLDEIMALFATLLALAAVPSSLLLVALPAAGWFEYQGWWLVNESVLTERWLTIGVAVAVASWLVWPSLLPAKRTARLKVERWRILIREPGGDRIVHTRELARVWVSTRGLRLERRDGTDTVIDLPVRDPALLRELGQLIVSHAEHDGSKDAIPEVLQQLLGRPNARRVAE